MEAVEAAIKAGRIMVKLGKRVKRVRKGIRRLLKRNERLGFFWLDREIRVTVGPSRKGILESFCSVRQREEPGGAIVRGRMRLRKQFKPGD